MNEVGFARELERRRPGEFRPELHHAAILIALFVGEGRGAGAERIGQTLRGGAMVPARLRSDPSDPHQIDCVDDEYGLLSFLVYDRSRFGALAGLPELQKACAPICPVNCRSVTLDDRCDIRVSRSCMIEREDSYGGHIQGERSTGNC
jgi:hypothetical protein